MKSPWAFAHVGFELAVTIMAGLVIGYWADNRWETAPWLMLAGLVFGAILGFYRFFVVVLGPQKEMDGK